MREDSSYAGFPYPFGPAAREGRTDDKLVKESDSRQKFRVIRSSHPTFLAVRHVASCAVAHEKKLLAVPAVNSLTAPDNQPMYFRAPRL